MAQTLVRKVTLKIAADDGDTEEKLDKITAKADELKALHPELSIKIDTAAASAKLGVLRQELKDIGKDAKIGVKLDDGAAMAKTAALGLELDRLKNKTKGPGLLSRIINGSDGENGGGGLTGLLSKIPVLGTLIENPGALLAVIPLIGAAGAEVGSLATGLTAAGLGVGSFAALAYPAFKQVGSALGDTKSQLALLPKPVQAAVGAVKGLENQFKTMSKAFEPTAFKIMNEGLGIASRLLPYVERFAYAAAPAVEGLVGMLSSGLQSQQFGYFMSFLEGLEGPVLTAIGSGMKGLAADVMTLMERFSKKDVINAVNIAFRVLGGALNLVTGLTVEMMDAWDLVTQKALPAVRVAFDRTRRAIAIACHDIADTFDTVRHGISSDANLIETKFDALRHAAATLAHDVAAHFDEIRHDIAQWAGDVRVDVGRAVTWFEQLPGRVMSGIASLPGKLFSAGRSAVSMFIAGLKSIPVVGTVIGWGQDIADHLPRSPAKKGPLSGSGSPEIAGRKIGLMLKAGMESSAPAVSASAAHLARAAGIGAGYGHPGYGAAGGGQVVTVKIDITGGPKEFRTWFKKNMRITGGNAIIIGA